MSDSSCSIARADRLFEPLPLAHELLRGLGVVPQSGIFHLGVELFETLVGAVPVEEPTQQRSRGIDLIDMSLRFGAHCETLGKPGCEQPY